MSTYSQQVRDQRNKANLPAKKGYMASRNARNRDTSNQSRDNKTRLPPAGKARNKSPVNLDHFTGAQKNIHLAVQEYLIHQGYVQTAELMNDEMADAKNNQRQQFVQDEQQAIQYMGQAFNTGKREHFFSLWQRTVPINLRSEDLTCQKLEFYLRIYFAVYPCFMAQGPPKQIDAHQRVELDAFREWLDTSGAHLSKTSEFLQYYALPYVTNPMEHPTFRAVCSKKWATDLRNKLREFLQSSVPRNSTPQLFHWYANFKKKAGLHVAEGHELARADHQSPEVEDLRDKLLTLQKHYVILEKKEDYAKSTLVES